MGLSTKQIANLLDLSPRTVEEHVEGLLRKTRTSSRTGLVVAAPLAANCDGQLSAAGVKDH